MEVDPRGDAKAKFSTCRVFFNVGAPSVLCPGEPSQRGYGRGMCLSRAELAVRDISCATPDMIWKSDIRDEGYRWHDVQLQTELSQRLTRFCSKSLLV